MAANFETTDIEVTDPDFEEPIKYRLSFGRLIRTGTKAFGINFLLLLALHWFPPVALLVPVGTGYVTGWNEAASLRDGALIGAVMGAWMALLCGIVVAGLVVASYFVPGGLASGSEIGIGLVCGFLVLHLAIFAGAGAMIGGHFARRDQPDYGGTV